jgi:uncharacterized membrane protein YhiD involved in acid resistance
MLSDLQQLNLFSLSYLDIISHLTVALAAGIFLAWLYKSTYKGAGYTSGFVSSLVLLTLITALVIMVIGNNLARAFGLVGAMSIIRFRTAIKDIMDIVFIFLSLAIGMASGVGYFKLVMVGLIFIGVTTRIILNSKLVNPRKNEFLLQFIYKPNGTVDSPYQNVLDTYCSTQKIINVKSVDEQSGELGLAFYVKMKNTGHCNELVNKLSQTGVNSINLFYDDETI